MVNHRIHKAAKLNFHHRLQSLYRHTYSGSRDSDFRKRCIYYSPIAELVQEPIGHTKHTAVHADVLTEKDNSIVVLHRARERAVKRTHHRELFTQVNSTTSFCVKNHGIPPLLYQARMHALFPTAL